MMGTVHDNRFYRETPERIGMCEMISRRRKLLGKSLQQLADASGLSKQQIHALETGKSSNPSVSTLIVVAASLGMSAHALFRAAVIGLDQELSTTEAICPPVPSSPDSTAQCGVCGAIWDGVGGCQSCLREPIKRFRAGQKRKYPGT
jgi:DNA-binding XRE family transcriptional regulator